MRQLTPMMAARIYRDAVRVGNKQPDSDPTIKRNICARDDAPEPMPQNNCLAKRSADWSWPRFPVLIAVRNSFRPGSQNWRGSSRVQFGIFGLMGRRYFSAFLISSQNSYSLSQVRSILIHRDILSPKSSA